MINWLNIKNLALVESAEIEFTEGFNVITGETGAGKSVIMGAISLLLGERAGKSIIRKNSSKCEICAGISLTGKIAEKVTEILKTADINIEENEEILIKRVVTQSTSRNFINDTPVVLQTMKKLGDLLIDIHGANEHQSLLKSSVQLGILDSYGKLKKDVKKCYDTHCELRNLQNKLEDLKQNIPSPIEAEHLKSIISTIENANINIEIDSQLNERHKKAAHSKEIIEISEISDQIISESETSIINQLCELRKVLQPLNKLEIQESETLLEQCDIITETTKDLLFDIESLASKIDIDEAEFIQMEERLQTLQSLKRKFGPTLDDILKTADQANAKLANLENFSFVCEELEEKCKKTNDSLKMHAKALTKKRKKISEQFSNKVVKELKKLGFPKADFTVQFNQTTPGPKGADSIDFLFSANPGIEPAPLKKVASSGEISRVMLALKTVLADSDSVPILIFDEIDVNIGGETASIVGSELKKLGKTHQLISISHLPQVAANADSHFKVEKFVNNNMTFTKITPLNIEDRKIEITRMLGGSNAATNHAKELLNLI